MWLRRLTGGALEVVEGVETRIGEPFEVPDDVADRLIEAEDESAAFDKKHKAKHVSRFEQAPKSVAAKAEAASHKAPEPVSTGPGSIAAEDVKTSTKTGPVKPVARRSD